MFTEILVPPPSRGFRPGIIYTPPFQDYPAVLELQRKIWSERVEERRPDTLILVEHPPVFTLGRRSKPEHWGGEEGSLKHMGYDVYEVERGGSVTYHGPGQIVGYPILRLRDFCTGPKAYVRMLEEVVIRVLREWGIPATRVEKLVGVWVSNDAIPLTSTLSRAVGEGKREELPVSSAPSRLGEGIGEGLPFGPSPPAAGDGLNEKLSLISSPPFGGRGEGEGSILPENLRKIAAMGVRISRGVTFHGFALNVNVQLKPFELITPCGIEGCQVTSMEMVLDKSVNVTEVREQITRHFGEVFGLKWNV